MESPKTKARAQANELRRCAAETALLEKHLKTKLAVAADHFNRDYRKGFQYLQVICVIYSLVKGASSILLMCAWHRVAQCDQCLYLV